MSREICISRMVRSCRILYVWGMYYISTDWCTFLPFPQHHSPVVNLCEIISFGVMLSVCPVLPQSWPISLRCLRSSEKGPQGRFLHLWRPYENPQLQMCPGADSFVHLITQLKDSGIWKFLCPQTQTSCYHYAQDLIVPDSSNDCLPVWCRTISLTNVISLSMGKVMKSWIE